MHAIRRILARTAGHRHGPITRLVSPREFGSLIKPFVFLDYIDAPGDAGPNFGFHPHSGIATLTYPLNFDVEHESSSGQIDLVERGGIEWLVTGRGVWHRSKSLNGDSLQGFQIWFALPPSHEHAAASAQFIAARDVPGSGPVRVLLGQYGDALSPVPSMLDLNYLWVNLQDGETWTYTPPASHDIAWTFAQKGMLAVSDETLRRELAIFEEGAGSMTFRAHGDCGFLVGSAHKHAHELVVGKFSIHTTPAALATGQRRIAEIGEALRLAGLRD